MPELLKICNLEVYYHSREGSQKVLDGVNLSMERGEVLSIVGESGCGKSTLALSIARLLPENGQIKEGEIIYNGKNLMEFCDKDLENIRGREIGYIFQDPTACLNPVISIGEQLIETIQNCQDLKGQEAQDAACSLLELVKIPEPREHLKFFPHQLSGGMNQRVMIALALASKPRLLIADEPTSNLDVTIEAAILELLMQLRRRLSLSIIFISHDLSLVRYLADKIAVMQEGKIIEFQNTEDLFKRPKTDYVKELLNASCILSEF